MIEWHKVTWYSKLGAVILFIFLIPAWTFYIGTQYEQTREVVSSETNSTDSNLLHYSSSTYGISFSYPNTYVLSDADVHGSGGSTYHEITLTQKKDLPLPVNGEGPTAITIDLFKNTTDKYTTEEWIRNSKESKLRLGEGRIASTTVSGLPALSYRWSGLYEGTTIAVARPNWVYTFTVTYMEMGADIIQDFVKVRDSVRISE